MKFFTPPNQLTSLRIILTPVFLYLFLSPDVILQQWSIIVFTLAALTDWYDGWLARKWGYVTVWGAFLDPLADKVLTSATLITYSYLGILEMWMVWIIVVRDIFITLLRSYGEYREKPIATPMLAKTKTFSQFVLIYYILILYVAKNTPLVSQTYGMTIEILLNHQLIFWMMLAVTLLTLWTGIVHLYDNRLTIMELFEFLHIIKTRKANSTFVGEEPSFITKAIASGLFCGYLSVASGTFGSILAVLLFCIPGFEKPLVFATIILASFIIGMKTSAIMEKRYGHDPAEVTIDEMTGMWISLFLLPKTFPIIIVAFLMFRLLDIFKPFPAKTFDKMAGGLGIMLDDVVVGIYTNIFIRLILLIPFINQLLI